MAELVLAHLEKYAPERGILNEVRRQGTTGRYATTDNNSISAARRNLTDPALTLIWVA